MSGGCNARPLNDRPQQRGSLRGAVLKMPTETVRRFFESLERRDLDAAIDCLHERVYFVAPAQGADFSAHEGFRRWWDLQISGSSEIRPLEIEALDSHRVFATLLIGRPGHGGHTWVSETLGCVYTVRDGAIRAIEMFADADRAHQRARRAVEVLSPDGLLQDS